MSINVPLGLTFRVDGPEDGEALAQSAQTVMDALLELEGCNSELSDAGVAMDASEMTVEVEITASGGDAQESLERAMAAIRTAIHAAGYGTPDWPTQSDVRTYAPPDLGEVEGSSGSFHLATAQGKQ